MNNNFSLGNKTAAQVKMQSDMYNSILHNQKMLAHALKQSAARQHAPAPAPAPAHRVHKKNKFNSLLSKMNEQRKK